MTRWRLFLLTAVAALLAFGPAKARAQVRSEPPGGDRQLFLARTIGSLEADGRRSPLGVTLMPRGPLFSIRQVAERLGGTLIVGPLGDSHELRLGDTSFLFGPESAAVTHGEEIIELSQAPQVATDGLRVPLDLLEAIYTELDGKQFSWRANEKTLAVGSRNLGSLPVAVDVVHLQGVSTVVLQFPVRPRYRLSEEPGKVTVHVLGDRIAAPEPVAESRGGLIRGVRFGAQEISIALAPGAGTESYELSNPYRLVFDVFPRGAAPATEAIERLPRRKRIPTIVIDPGHGGSDEGAHGGELLEKDLTLRLARLLRSKLQAALPVRVVLTRDEDADLPLDTRAALANQLKAELFVSLAPELVLRQSRDGRRDLLPQPRGQRRARPARRRGRQPRGRQRPAHGPPAHPVGHGAESPSDGQSTTRIAHPGRAQRDARSAQSWRQAGAVQGIDGRGDAGGPRGAGLLEQPARGRAAAGPGLPERARGGVDPRSRAVPRARSGSRHPDRGRQRGLRVTRTQAVLFVSAAVLVGLLVGALWVRRGAPAPGGDLPGEESVETVVVGSVILYFPGSDGRLHPELRALDTNAGATELVRRIVASLIGGPDNDALFAPLPSSTEISSVVLGADGTLYLDLASSDYALPPVAGSQREIAAAYSLVNSICGNVPRIRGVVLLWNSEQRATFAGNLDTTRPLTPNRGLVTESS